MSALTDARKAVGGLSKPGKMPGPAYSTPAADCVTGSKLRQVPGSVCSACYACKGRYMFDNVQTALRRRADAMRNDPAWTANMATAINGAPFFRWFDSGDLQGTQDLDRIAEVARATPNTRHWLPTREKAFLARWLRAGNAIPENLTIRLSAPMIDGKAPTAPQGVNTSTVHASGDAQGYACPSRNQGNQCGDCRACWDRTIDNVSYKAH